MTMTVHRDPALSEPFPLFVSQENCTLTGFEDFLTHLAAVPVTFQNVHIVLDTRQLVLPSNSLRYVKRMAQFLKEHQARVHEAVSHTTLVAESRQLLYHSGGTEASALCTTASPHILSKITNGGATS